MDVLQETGFARVGQTSKNFVFYTKQGELGSNLMGPSYDLINCVKR